LTETTASVKIRRMELDKKQREVLGKGGSGLIFFFSGAWQKE